MVLLMSSDDASTFSLNYHHLQYFWLTAREGSLTRASRRLGLAPSTVSAQIRTLESSMGRDLFERRGRRLCLTEAGEMVLEYADRIFSLGEELSLSLLQEELTPRTRRMRVGAGEPMAAATMQRLLDGAAGVWAEGSERRVRFRCEVGTTPSLLGQLSRGQLDAVIAASPLQDALMAGLRSEPLGAAAVHLLAAPALAEAWTGTLGEQPLLMPTEDARLHNALRRHLDLHQLRPPLAAELGSPELLAAFARAGAGLMPATAADARALAGDGLVDLGPVEGLSLPYVLLVNDAAADAPVVDALLRAGREALIAAHG